MLAKETEKQQLRRGKEANSMCHGRKCFKKRMVSNSDVDETSNKGRIKMFHLIS